MFKIKLWIDFFIYVLLKKDFDYFGFFIKITLKTFLLLIYSNENIKVI